MRPDRGLQRGQWRVECKLLFAALCLVQLLMVASGCRRDDEVEPSNEESVSSAVGSKASENVVNHSRRVRRPLLEDLAACDVSHRGTVIDLGNVAADARRHFLSGPFLDVKNQTRAKKSYAEVFTRELRYGFWLPRPLAGARIALRADPGLADRVSVYLDDTRLGTLRLGSSRVVVSPEARATLEPGRHQVTLRFASKRALGEVPYATLDWLWIGNDSQLDETYAAPTFDDVVTDVAFGGEPRRAFVLRAPSSVRCTFQAVQGSRFDVRLGFWGSGRGTAQIRALVDGEPPVVLSEHVLEGGEEAAWLPVSADLSRFDSRLVSLEMAVTEAEGSGRIAFGEPELSLAQQALPDAARVADNVVVVVLSGTERRQVPPWGPALGLRAFADLVRQGVTFNGYRAKSTVVAANLGSLLTGAPPRVHTVEDPSAALPAAWVTVQELLKEQSGRGAFFTSVPASFKSFGFAEGWDRQEEYSPVEDMPATQPFLDAMAFLKGGFESSPGQRQFVVIHARGGHPPWDVSKNEVLELPPEEYTGALEPRRGGTILAELRHQRRNQRLKPDDWTRLIALQTRALQKQDQAMMRLLETLGEAGVWDRTLFVVMGDVAMGDPPEVPFGVGPLGEDRLMAPLIVKFPGGTYGGRQTGSLCSPEDVAATISEALGIKLPVDYGRHLLRVFSGDGDAVGAAATAVLGNQYATRWGPWLLTGDFGGTPRLCNLEIDPSCVRDTLDKNPISASALWRAAFAANALGNDAKVRHSRRNPASIDEFTAKALTVWGE